MPLQRPFELRAAGAPQAAAIISPGAELSYAELERRSARVAGWIAAGGMGGESRVAVCASRSVELIAGLLGVLRAGAAYLPIDPALPLERVSALLEASGAPFLLSDAEARGRLPGLGGEDLA